jgi:hypothetical protein
VSTPVSRSYAERIWGIVDYERHAAMKKAFATLTVGAVAAHHVIETAGGLGLPGEPVLGRRNAAVGWTAAFAANLALVSRMASSESTRTTRVRKRSRPGTTRARAGRDVARNAAIGFANGAYQALALQHYVDWPWIVRRGLPILTEAEGLPQNLLPPYNAALLSTIAASTAAVISSRRSRAFALGHCAGLATLPLQPASARHHIDWWRTGRHSSQK